jgi:hypothetical protein
MCMLVKFHGQFVYILVRIDFLVIELYKNK